MTRIQEIEFAQTLEFCFRLKAYLKEDSENRLILLQDESKRGKVSVESLERLKVLRDEILTILV